jgi:cell division transport system ATP-binding protein
MIRLEHVTKIYSNGIKALDDVSFSIQKGEFVFIVGGSGSGKTSIIKAIMREIDVTHGSIYIEGVDVTRIRRSKIPKLRRNLGIVFQDFRLLPNRTVYQNVAFALKITETPQRNIRRTVPTLLSMVGLSKVSKMKPNELSGGEQQRTALARAIANNPPILIADEPTGNLDPTRSWEIMKLLQDINLRGTTVVVVTHDKEIVDAMKKRVIALSNGRVVKDTHKGDYSHET